MYRLKPIILSKYNYQHELHIIYNIADRNNLNLNTIKKIHKRIKEKIKHNTPNNIMKYCSMKYQNNSLKF